jgi:hypothetical protein
MTLLTRFANRSKTDPWWDLEGVAARRDRARRRIVGNLAFLIAEIACGLTLAVWLARLHPVLGVHPFG